MKTSIEVGITPHAIERYKSRLGKDHLPSNQIRKEIRSLMDFAFASDTPPVWLSINGRRKYDKNHCYIIVSDDIIFPAKKLSAGGYLLLSCITRGSLSPEKRNRKNKKNQIKRTRKGAGLRRWNGR